MLTVLLVVQIIVAIVLVIVVLMQRSEGGALGIGGGGGGGGAGGGLMSGRGVAGALVRTTVIFGAIFFATSLGLTTIATNNDRGGVTELEESLESDAQGQSLDDALGVEGLGDLRDPSISVDLSDDPLAQPVVTTPDTATPETSENADEPQTDPLADPLADPQ